MSVSVFKSILESVYAMSKKSPMDYSDLDTSSGSRTFVYASQAMATVIEYVGLRRVSGPTEVAILCERTAEMLTQYFSKEAHDFQFVLNRDEMTPEKIRQKLQPCYDSAAAMGMSEVIDDIFDEQCETMARCTMDDTIAIVLITRTAALRKEDYKEWARERIERRNAGDLFSPIGTQDESRAIDPMQAIHDAYVDAFRNTLADAQIGASCKVLNCDEASSLIANVIDPLGKGKNFKAWLLPETVEEAATRFMLRKNSEPVSLPAAASVQKAIDERFKQRGTAAPKITKVGNASMFFPPPLKEQLITEEAFYPKTGYLQYGNRLYCTISATVPPRRTNVIGQELISHLSEVKSRHKGLERRVPFRLSMRVRSAGLKQGQFRSMVVPLVIAGAEKNRKFMHAYRALQSEKNTDKAMASLSISLTTWVDLSEPDATGLLQTRVVALRASASQWGDMNVTEDSLDRVQAFLDSCPALTLGPCSNEATGTLRDIMPLIPWSRPASPLSETGTELYRSLDGALLPLEQHSGKQDYWLGTFTAPMGGGKSAQANRKHFDYCFAPGRKKLPYLHVIDIGGSVSGMVHLIQDALPSSLKHMAYTLKLLNRAEHGVNMLDPKPGLRYPFEGDLQTTVEFLTALVTPAERLTPYDNMSEFCRALLMETYKYYDERNEQGNPHRYNPGMSDPESIEIDMALAERNIDISPGTPYYAIADKLASAGNYRVAMIAHRRGTPTLGDVQKVAQMDNVRGVFMKALTDQQLPIPDAFNVQLGLALTSYPIFADRTKIDLRGRRVTAFDLNDVSNKSSAGARKQSCLMYMVAYELFSRNFRMTDEDFKPGMSNIPEEWRAFYRSEFDDVKNTPKHVTIDEYHRTDMFEGVEGLMNADRDTMGIRATLVREGGRESRKWGLSLYTISQQAQDHGKLLSLASENHILSLGSSPDELSYMVEKMDLTPIVVTAMKYHCRGPKRGIGVSFMSQWSTKTGTYTQQLTSTVGPRMLWSLSSSFEDKHARSLVFDAVGRKAGRALLGQVYPDGTMKDEIERRMRDVSSKDDNPTEGAIKIIANELIAQYRRDPSLFR